MLLQFGPWAPDVADLNTTVAATARNVIPADGSYLPFPTLTGLTQAINAKPLGGIMARTTGGGYAVYVGTATKLYRLSGGDLSWENVTPSGTSFAASDTSPWSFVQYGTDVVATNGIDDVQVIDVDSGTDFAVLGGSPPRARHVAVWGDFLVLGNFPNSPNAIQWSGLDEIDNWTVGSNNSDIQYFPDGGAVMGLSSSNTPLIVQEQAIRRGVFQPGSREVFTFDKLHDQIGAKSPYSVCGRDALVFFFAEDGFYAVSYGGELMPIGFERVNRTVLGGIDQSWLDRIGGAVDPVHSRVYFSFKSDGTGFDGSDTILVYDWRLQRWTESKQRTHLLVPIATPGYTLDNIGLVSGASEELTDENDEVLTDEDDEELAEPGEEIGLDSLPFSLDSRLYAGGAPVLGAFTEDYSLGFFSGDNAEAILETSEIGATDGQVQQLAHIMPVVDTDAVTVEVGHRLRRNAPIAYLTGREPSANTGMVLVRCRSRYMKFRVRIAAGANWTHARGVDPMIRPAGFR